MLGSSLDSSARYRPHLHTKTAAEKSRQPTSIPRSSFLQRCSLLPTVVSPSHGMAVYISRPRKRARTNLPGHDAADSAHLEADTVEAKPTHVPLHVHECSFVKWNVSGVTLVAASPCGRHIAVARTDGNLELKSSSLSELDGTFGHMCQNEDNLLFFPLEIHPLQSIAVSCPCSCVQWLTMVNHCMQEQVSQPLRNLYASTVTV